MLGVAGNMRVKILEGQDEVNNWLINHSDVEVIDMKFSSYAINDESSLMCANMVMIIYKKI